MTEVLDWVTLHPFWSLYIAILLGIAIHGFRTTHHVTHYHTNEEKEN